MPRPVHFEIHAADPQRAIGFYEQLFGWKFEEYPMDQPYWGITTGDEGTPGINGGLTPRQGDAPSMGQAVSSWVCTVDVPSVDDYVAKAKSAGGSVAVEKMAIPNMAWIAYCLDTEGNIFGLYQDDPSAQ